MQTNQLCKLASTYILCIQILSSRCNQITSLNLRNTSITKDSVTMILHHLKQTLEELNVNDNKINFENLIQLKSLPRLKVLNCLYLHNFDEIETLRRQMPHLIINRKTVSAAAPNSSFEPKVGLWDIKVNQLDLFQEWIDYKLK